MSLFNRESSQDGQSSGQSLGQGLEEETPRKLCLKLCPKLCPFFWSGTTAFTLIELIAVIVVSTIAVSALVAVFYQSARLLQTQDAAGLATRLADERMQEIRSKSFRDPQTLAEYAADPGENPAGPRKSFDDVDDYAGWSTNQPVDLDGNVLSNYVGFTETAAVTNVAATNFNVTVAPSVTPAFKRIVVTESNASVRVVRTSVVSEYD